MKKRAEKERTNGILDMGPFTWRLKIYQFRRCTAQAHTRNIFHINFYDRTLNCRQMGSKRISFPIKAVLMGKNER